MVTTPSKLSIKGNSAIYSPNGFHLHEFALKSWSGANFHTDQQIWRPKLGHNLTDIKRNMKKQQRKLQ